MQEDSEKALAGCGADLIAAGWPCQDISIAGPGTGLSGTRSGLFWNLAECFRLVRPRLGVLENVAEVLGRGMGEVCGTLAELGYDTEWDCLPTGLPMGHKRCRVLLVADLVREGPQKWSKAGAHPQDARKLFTWARFANALTPTLPAEKWGARPLLDRGIHGIPNRMDRIKSLGNSVNPAFPEIIGRAIMSAK